MPVANWAQNEFAGKLICIETGAESSVVSSGFVPISQVRTMVSEISGGEIDVNLKTLTKISQWFSNEYSSSLLAH
jgi:hypothetical protein